MDRRRVILLVMLVLAIAAELDLRLNGARAVEGYAEAFTLRVGDARPVAPDAVAELRQVYAAAGTEKLFLEDAESRVRVQAGPVTDVTVGVSVFVYAPDAAVAQEYARQLRLEASVADGVLRPRLLAGPWDGIRRVGVIWEIVVPEGMPVEVALNRGSVSVAGVQAPVSVRTAGEIAVTGVRGGVTVRSAGADVTITDVAGDLDVDVRLGSTDVRRVTGNVTIRKEAGDVHVLDVEGDLEVEGMFGVLTAQRVSGTARVRMDSAKVELAEVAGSVQAEVGMGSLYIRPEAAAPITAAVGMGELTLAVPAALVPQYTFDLQGTRSVEVRFDADGLTASNPEGHRVTASVGTGTLAVQLVP